MLLRIIHKAEETIIALLLVSMTLLVFFETLLRFAFGVAADRSTLGLGASRTLKTAPYTTPLSRCSC